MGGAPGSGDAENFSYNPSTAESRAFKWRLTGLRIRAP
jgi:hypothetical protein